MHLTCTALRALRDAAAQIGETTVTIEAESGVITFDFSRPDEARARVDHHRPATHETLSPILAIK